MKKLIEIGQSDDELLNCDTFNIAKEKNGPPPHRILCPRFKCERMRKDYILRTCSEAILSAVKKNLF